MQQGGQVQGWGDAFMSSLANAVTVLLAAIPRIIGFFLILIIGWFLASALAKGTAALLRAVRFDDVARRARFDELSRRLGTEASASGFIAGVIKWIIRIVTLMVAFEALGLTQIGQLFESLLLWIPNLIVSLAVLLLAGLATQPIGNLVHGAASEADFGNPDALARAAQTGVWVFAAIVALTQLGIADNLIYALFYGFVAAVALAFGLGGRETAGRIVDRWHRAAQEKRGHGHRGGMTPDSGAL
jgi:small-conductance mechanosensitive channel